jgi:carbonic anhydrase
VLAGGYFFEAKGRPEMMERLIAGHKRFLSEVFPGRRSQFHLLAEGQAPEWLFITCSDSRVLPDLFLGTGP